MISIPTVMLSYHRRGFFKCAFVSFKSSKFRINRTALIIAKASVKGKNCNTVIFPAAPPSVPAVRGPPQGRSKKVVTSKTHNEHCPAYLAPDHGLLYIWTELLYLTCPHEADLLTLIMSHKLTQYL